MPQLAIAVVGGALLAYLGNTLPDPFWTFIVPLALLLAVFNQRLRMPLVFIAAYLWSCAWLGVHLDYRLIPAYDNRVTLLTGEIVDLPRQHQGATRFLLRPLWIENYPARLPRRLQLTWYRDDLRPAAGEVWRFEAKLRQPRAMLNPGGFDYEAWQFTRGIDGGGYVRTSAANRRLHEAGVGAVDFWRARLAAALDRQCGDCRHVGLLRALLVGDRARIEPTDRQLLTRTATAHLLAISGLHVGLVAGICFWIGRRGWSMGLYRLHASRESFAALAGFGGACVYAALAGFALPTLRALVMLAVMLLAQQRCYRSSLTQSLALAVCLIVLLDPRAVGSASFWLSVLAILVISICLFDSHRLAGWRQLLKLQWYFALLHLPIGITVFAQVSTSGLAANLVAVPLVSLLVLPLLLLGSLLMLLPGGLAGACLRLADLLLGGLTDYLQWLETAGPGVIAAGSIPPLLNLLLALVLLVLVLPLGRPARVMACALGLGLAAWRPPLLAPGDFAVTVFDVGLGTAVLVRTRHYSLVYDLGPGRAEGFNATDRVLLPALNHFALDLPERIVVSHVDQDHSGGLYSRALADLPAGRLVSGTPAELRRRYAIAAPVGDCHQLDGWRRDGVSFTFLALASRSPRAGNTNNRSCVLRVGGHHSLLLPGDIEVDSERRLLQEHGEHLAADILLSPHHGSGTSSSAEFIAAVAPLHVVHSASRNNRWGFPRDAVTARYRAAGSRQYRSDDSGAIELHSSAAGLSLRAIRQPVRRIWRRW
ncbi:MAG: DNA internalization-related competence protein ComEC/Rec2 [Gammaproteobacteria bacterium]|nr:DNA internalization-related competence protein ComEC/Rec2 [Gammaproteobacteria bacterium]